MVNEIAFENSSEMIYFSQLSTKKMKRQVGIDDNKTQPQLNRCYSQYQHSYTCSIKQYKAKLWLIYSNTQETFLHDFR